jgi:CHAT domain-containing protein
VKFQDGRSSFRETLEPIYLGLTDLLLRQSGRTGDGRAALLRQARDTVELIKQTELQDFLRDRCTVESARTAQAAPAAGTAVYYPIILPDRLELLLETAAASSAAAWRCAATRCAAGARPGGRAACRRAAAGRAPRPAPLADRRWKRTCCRPAHHTLVAVPDGVLRLLPLAALHDGRDFVVQRWPWPPRRA